MIELKEKDCYVISNIETFKNLRFDYISFDEIFKSKACIGIRTKDYFQQFFGGE